MKRTAARIALAIMVLSAATIVLPMNVSKVAQAAAQILPTPTLPDPTDIIKNTPKPDPSPSTSPAPDPGDGGGGDGGGGTGGGDTGGSGGGGKDSDSGRGKEGRKKEGNRKGRNGGKRGGRGSASRYEGTFTPQGSFSTDRLVAVAARLRSLGVSSEEIMERVYAPFIIGGNAAWTNTWGAPRYGPAPGQVRTHEGQDVFCTSGDPILASEPGTVDYGDGGLGGKVARLHRPDGSYWYYAHLSEFNDREFPSGSTVDTGDVIGFCGNSGNALTTPSHVHFGWYKANGDSKDPMGFLVRWLHIAERRATGSISKAQNTRIRLASSFTTARRFGDAFVPSLSEGSEVSLLSLNLDDAGELSPPENPIMAALSPFVQPNGVTAASGPSSPDAQVDAILQDTGYSTESGD